MNDTPSVRERMLAGELYVADDPELAEQSARA
jgi:Maltose acetyltransferase hexapeptide capping motif